MPQPKENTRLNTTVKSIIELWNKYHILAALLYYGAKVPAPPPQSCPYSSKSSFRENASPDSTTEPPPEAATNTNTNLFPKAQIESIEETMKDTEMTPEQVTEYCKNVFVFKELEVAKFKTWKERKAYDKQSQKKK